MQSMPLSWEDFATPRQLLSGLAEQSGVEILGVERVPHDLWGAAHLPSLSLMDRLTLLANQFDLTFQISPDGGKVRLVPVPDEVLITREYAVGRQAEQLAEQWATLLPDSRIRVSGGKVIVQGTIEDQERIASRRHPSAPPGASELGLRRTGKYTRYP